MESKELRIGNYIRDKESGRIGYVISIGEKKCTVKMPFSKLSQSYDDFEGIDLNEDWLLKLGFEDKYLTIDKKISSDFTMTLISDKDGGFHFMPHATLMWGVDLKYVHQLQNLYFALTGSELTIKERL